MTRLRAEAARAVRFAIAIMLAGGTAICFISTMSVQSDPAAVPSTVAAAPARLLGHQGTPMGASSGS